VDIVYLLLAAIIVLLWLERQARRKAEERAEKMEQARVRACLQVYNGWVGTNWFDFVKDYSKKQGLDYMALVSGIKLAEITEDDASISPWDTPETIRERAKDGLIPWEVHPDADEITEQFKKNVANERERMELK
jgi:hypothetical protein